MKKGFYIMLEGGEGCGKDYQVDLIETRLRKNYEVIITREPGGTFEAEQIREILLANKNKLSPITELFLYEAARRDLNEKVIMPKLEKGGIILSKRGFPSTYAYQGFGGGLDLKIIERENNLAMRNCFPDLICIIDIDPVIGLQKEVNPDRFAAKELEYHKKVREGYLDFARKYSDISVIIPYQEGNPQKMQEEIIEHIKKKLNITNVLYKSLKK